MHSSLSLCLAMLLVATSSIASAQEEPSADEEPTTDEEPVTEEEDDPLEAMSIPSTELEPEAEDEPVDEPEAEDTKPEKAKAARKPVAVVSVTPAAPPPVLPYEEGQTIPDGYEPASRMRTGLVIGGAITFLVPYLSTVAVALRARGDARQGYISDHEAEELAPLYIPIAGPFIAIGTHDRDDAREIAPFVASGVVQAAGVAMFIAGLASQKQVLVRKQAVVTPLLSGTTAGLAVTGSF